MFYQSIFKICRFSNSRFERTAFFNCLLENVVFRASDLTFAYFNDSFLHQVKFLASKLLYTNFFNAKVTDSEMIDSDLTDCLLLNAKPNFKVEGGVPHRITKPLIGLS